MNKPITNTEIETVVKKSLKNKAQGQLAPQVNSIRHLLLLLLCHFSRVQLCATPKTAAHQAPPSLEFSRQEHWSGLPFPSPSMKVKGEAKSLSRV